MNKTTVVMCDSLINVLKERIGSGEMYIGASELLESFNDLVKNDSESLHENSKVRHIDSDCALLEAIYNNIGANLEEGK